MMNLLIAYFAYIRVSTAKQGEKGVSLQEQRDAICRYAKQHSLNIVEWFEERETAAKRGRPVFMQMLKRLKKGEAKGVIIHKIDRSARNLRDWADLGEMIDHGIEVHFANESLDLRSRGGRLSADIQAVVAADFIRNLKDEARKGMYGRLKQGIYPMRAPIGYLDHQGKGNPQIPDPQQAPAVRKTFELYASGRYSLFTLAEAAFGIGLRNKNGKRVSVNSLSAMLNNPFYIGLMRLKRTNETFPGHHEPIVPTRIFNAVKEILRGKTPVRHPHDFTFRRRLSCQRCKHSLIGERQKGHVYYRCHTRDCPQTGIREEAVHEQVVASLAPLILHPEEEKHFANRITLLKQDRTAQRESEERAISLNITAVTDRLNRLTDAYLDTAIDKEAFETRKASLLVEKKQMEEKLSDIKGGREHTAQLLEELFELLRSAELSHEIANRDIKPHFLNKLCSNFVVDQKNVVVELKSPFFAIANRPLPPNGARHRDEPRTFHEEVPRIWDALIIRLQEILSKDPNGFGLDDKPTTA
jgi:site-specific DNA recombinase